MLYKYKDYIEKRNFNSVNGQFTLFKSYKHSVFIVLPISIVVDCIEVGIPGMLIIRFL